MQRRMRKRITQGMSLLAGSGMIFALTAASAPLSSNLPPLVTINGTAWYEISTPSQFLALLNDGQGTPYFDLLSGHIALMNNIALPPGTVIHSIGTNGVPFAGVFNGNGYTISGAVINSTNAAVGFFGEVTGTVENLGVADTVVGNSAYDFANRNGALVGWLNGGTLENVWVQGTLTNTSITSGDGSGNSGDGGLVGVQNGGSISNAYADVAVQGMITVGGLVGWQESGTIADSYFNGSVANSTAGGATGGLIGIADGSTAASFYAANAAPQGVGSGSAANITALSNPRAEEFQDAGWTTPPWALPALGWPTLAVLPTITAAPWTPPALASETVTINGQSYQTLISTGDNTPADVANGTAPGYLEERAALEAGVQLSGEGVDSSYLYDILSGNGLGLGGPVSPAQQGAFAAEYQTLGIIPTWSGAPLTPAAGLSALEQAGASPLCMENYLVQIFGYSWAAAQNAVTPSA